MAANTRPPAPAEQVEALGAGFYECPTLEGVITNPENPVACELNSMVTTQHHQREAPMHAYFNYSVFMQVQPVHGRLGRYEEYHVSPP